jgi:hypothetical protein
MSKLVASLPAFHVEKVLQEDSELKSCVLLGHFKLNEVAGKEEEKKCIAILEKQPFQTQQLDSLLKFFKEGKVKIHFENDIYTSTTIYPENEICETQSDYRSPYGIVSRFIYPADLLHIKKYSFQPCEIIEETKKVYTEVSLLYKLKFFFELLLFSIKGCRKLYSKSARENSVGLQYNERKG